MLKMKDIYVNFYFTIFSLWHPVFFAVSAALRKADCTLKLKLLWKYTNQRSVANVDP